MIFPIHNIYGYVLNDPINRFDSVGLLWWRTARPQGLEDQIKGYIKEAMGETKSYDQASRYLTDIRKRNMSEGMPTSAETPLDNNDLALIAAEHYTFYRGEFGEIPIIGQIAGIVDSSFWNLYKMFFHPSSVQGLWDTSNPNYYVWKYEMMGTLCKDIR